jgi:hypothetical protein
VALSFSVRGPPVRMPRLRAILNGSICVGPQTAQITHYSSFSAASYNLVVPLTANAPLTAADWAAFGRIRVKIQVAASPTEPYIDLIDGYSDTIQIHPISGWVCLEGRDLSASMLDSKTPADFQNQSSAEIVQLLCERHGLTPVVASIGGYAGRHYGQNNTILTLAQYAKLASDWDILVTLGQASGYDLFVDGTDLYFQPGVSASESTQYIFASNLTDLRMTRLLPLSGGSAVTVASWNSALGRAVTATGVASASGNSAGPAAQPMTQYTAMRPNLIPISAQALASQIVQSIGAEAMSIQFTMPGDTSLSARYPIRLEGSGTAFDLTYRIESIARTFRSRSGFSQTVRAKLSV